MGCDIHIIIEKKHEGKWVGWPCDNDNADGRNYARFAKLAGVRGPGPAAKGVPPDASDYTRMMQEDGSLHSWSWGTVKNVGDIFADTTCYDDEDEPLKATKEERERAPYKFFSIDRSEVEDYRIIYAFDS